MEEYHFKLTFLKVNSENQQDATNSMFIIKLSISTCFGHHCAHHQENKTVFDNKHGISCILLALSIYLIFTMHGHKILKPTFLVPQGRYKTLLFIAQWCPTRKYYY